MCLTPKGELMIADSDRETIIRYARKYNARSVYLFGSSLDDRREASDIDLAVEGIAPAAFFRFYGELLRHLSRPVDVVDLSKKTLFSQMVEERGVRIYG